jgi:hypothetical protein
MNGRDPRLFPVARALIGLIAALLLTACNSGGGGSSY